MNLKGVIDGIGESPAVSQRTLGIDVDDRQAQAALIRMHTGGGCIHRRTASLHRFKPAICRYRCGLHRFAPPFVTSRPPRYRQLADSLLQAIRAGRHRPGDRLPSVRDLCADHGMSLATVTHALHRLEDSGWIESRARLGFFVRAAPPAAASGVPTSSASALALDARRQRLMAMAAAREGLISLGHLALSPSLLPLPALRRGMSRHLKDAECPLASGTAYGSARLREQLARWVSRSGAATTAEDVVATHGYGESIQLCLSLLARPGDRIAVACPGSVRALEIVAALGLHAVEPTMPRDEEGHAAFKQFLSDQRPAAFIIDLSLFCVTAGPTTDLWKQRLLTTLKAHAVPIIECDLMGALHRGTSRSPPLRAFDTDDQVLYCGSLACITGPGCSVGFIVNGKRRMQLRAARSMHGELLPDLTDRVLASFLSDAAFDAHLRRLRLRLRQQVDALTEEVLRHFPAGTRVSAGEAGYVLWVRLPDGAEASVLLAEVQASGYTFVPGAVFTTTGQFDQCLRLTAGHPLNDVRLKGIRQLGETARRLMPGL